MDRNPEFIPGDEEPARRRLSRRYTVDEKLAYLREFAAGQESLRGFCERRRLNTKSFCRWRKQYQVHGAAGLVAKPNPRNQAGRTGKKHSPDERRMLVEAYLELQLPQSVFAKSYGISTSALGRWVRLYREKGPKGLESRTPGPVPGSRTKASLPESLKDAIVRTKRRFPDFGLRRIRDYLRRFFGLKVSAGGVRDTLAEAGIPKTTVSRRRRRRPDRLRRFERAKPMQLWQSDITSYVLRRQGRRVYLTVFLDDHSRYIAAWGLQSRQTRDLVCDALLDGIARFGKPEEVLTDQGRAVLRLAGPELVPEAARAGGHPPRGGARPPSGERSARRSGCGRRSPASSGTARSPRTCRMRGSASRTGSRTTTISVPTNPSADCCRRIASSGKSRTCGSCWKRSSRTTSCGWRFRSLRASRSSSTARWASGRCRSTASGGD